jgi:hypothetical protein
MRTSDDQQESFHGALLLASRDYSRQLTEDNDLSLTMRQESGHDGDYVS